MGKQQKKWENGTKGLKYANQYFFLILDTILRKKMFYSKALKFQKKNLEQLLVFG
jgi:hypothetical protein